MINSRMMRSMRSLAVAGLLVSATALPGLAQEQSMTCRLFPLACPGPVPPPPPPLLGTPEEQAQAAPPPMPAKHAMKRRRVQKHAAKSNPPQQ